MNEYEIAFVFSAVILAACVSAYVFSWVVQWGWCWVDDSKMGKKNWLAGKLTFTKWIYPVYNAHGGDLERAVKSSEEPLGYAKNKEHENKGVYGLEEGKDYKYSNSINSSIWLAALLFSLAPLVLLFSFKVYPLTLASITIVLIAYTVRFARRNKKMFDLHVTDKGAHKE